MQQGEAMQEIRLVFPPFEGEEEGLNDAGIETFEGDVGDYIARECGQNTTDASANETAELHFNLLEMSIDELPCLERLKEIFERCIDYWKDDPKAVSFFKRGIQCLQGEKLPVLKISDYGTTGLTGSDNDRTSRWYALVRAKGACNKGEGAGGSFGIGKYAPFTASMVRTVYYYTKTEEGEAFQGISRLVTHCNEEGKKVHSTGYIGECIRNDGTYTFRSIREPDSIPASFRRLRQGIGTDIYVPAYEKTEDWKEQFIISALNNFWPAICLKKISFRVGDEIIDWNNIETLVEQYKNNSDFKAYRYFNAYRKGKLYQSASVEHVGESALYLSQEMKRESYPIAVARKNGMIIERWSFKVRKPICGFYICTDPHGNEILRKLEPPRHDRWDSKRDAEGKQVLAAVRGWIRECIDDFLSQEAADAFQIEGISRYLPDDEFYEEKSPNVPGGMPIAPREGDEGEVLEPVVFAGNNNDGNETEVAVDKTASGTSGGSALAENGGGGGGSSSEGAGKGDGTGGTGEKGNKTSSTRNLMMRSIYDESEKSYTIILRTDQPFEGNIFFCAVGDDGEKEEVRIEKVMLGEKEIPLTNNGKGFFAEVEDGEAQRYKVIFEEKEKMSLRIL
jgi:hypothetical protein